MIDCFRNQFQILLKNKIIVKEKRISVEEACKRGITDVSKDGALLIKTKRNYYMDLNIIKVLDYNPYLRDKQNKVDVNGE